MEIRNVFALTCSTISLVALAACGLGNDPDGGAEGGASGGTGGAYGSGQPEGNEVVLNTSSSGAGTGEGGGSLVMSICDGVMGEPSTLELSFHGHSSMAGAQYARARLLHEPPLAPEPTLLRAEDFLAYYGLSYEGPANDDALSVRWYQDGDNKTPSTSGLLEVDYRASKSVREPLRLVVLVDVSQSVAGTSMLVQETIRSLASGFAKIAQAGDSMAVLTFAGDVVLELDGPMKEASLPYGGLDIDSLVLAPREGNDFVAAIRESVKVAGGLQSHVVLLTDGGTKVSEPLLTEIRAAASNGVRLSVAQIAAELTAGPAPLAQGFLESVASAGRGGQFYVARVEDAARAFDARFGASLAIHARATRLRLDLPPLLQAVGLPVAAPGAASGPSGGVLGAGAIHPSRIGLEATCPAVFTDQLTSGFTLGAALTTEGESILGQVSVDWAQLRGETAVTARNDAILAVAQALRTRTQTDIDKANERLDKVLPPNGVFECLECEQLQDLKDLLVAADQLTP